MQFCGCYYYRFGKKYEYFTYSEKCPFNPHQYFPPVYVALMPADISSSTIVSVLVFFLGRVSDGSGEDFLMLLREFAFET